MMGQKKARLPRGFREVEFLKSPDTTVGSYDNNAHIDLNIKPVAGISVVCVFEIPAHVSTYYSYFGCRSNVNFFVNNGDGNDNMFFWVNNKYKILKLPSNGMFELSMSDLIGTVEIPPGGNRYQTSFSASSFPDLSMFLFAYNYNGVGRGAGGIRCKKCDVLINGEKVRNLITCYRESDNKPGLYDLCGSICPLTNSPFYINSGTGEFLVGPEVN